MTWYVEVPSWMFLRPIRFVMWQIIYMYFMPVMWYRVLRIRDLGKKVSKKKGPQVLQKWTRRPNVKIEVFDVKNVYFQHAKNLHLKWCFNRDAYQHYYEVLNSRLLSVNNHKSLFSSVFYTMGNIYLFIVTYSRNIKSIVYNWSSLVSSIK